MQRLVLRNQATTRGAGNPSSPILKGMAVVKKDHARKTVMRSQDYAWYLEWKSGLCGVVDVRVYLWHGVAHS